MYTYETTTIRPGDADVQHIYYVASGGLQAAAQRFSPGTADVQHIDLVASFGLLGRRSKASLGKADVQHIYYVALGRRSKASAGKADVRRVYHVPIGGRAARRSKAKRDIPLSKQAKVPQKKAFEQKKTNLFMKEIKD